MNHRVERAIEELEDYPWNSVILILAIILTLGVVVAGFFFFCG